MGSVEETGKGGEIITAFIFLIVLLLIFPDYENKKGHLAMPLQI